MPVYCILTQSRDYLTQVLVSLFKDPANAQDFALKPVTEFVEEGEVGVVGERIITTPQSAEWWEQQQKTLPDPEKDVIASVILFSDETHMSNSGRVKAHPVMMTLANIPLATRWKPRGHRLVAFFPDASPYPQLLPEEKAQIMHTALEEIIAPLKRLSKT
jgi:hypothetical protein